MTGSRSTAHRAIAGVAALICLALAALWLVVTPDEAETADGVRQALLRYGHTGVWLLLGGAALMYALGASRRVVEAMAMCALGFYVAFVAAIVF